MVERVKKRPDEARVLYRTTRIRKRLLDAQAEARSMSLNDLIEQAVSMRLAFPEGLYEAIRSLAAEMHLPIATVIAHKMIKQVAWEHAWLKVFGRPSPSTSLEFRFNGNRLVTGDELLMDLTSEFEKILEDAKTKLQVRGDEAVHFSAAEMESILAGLKCEVN